MSNQYEVALRVAPAERRHTFIQHHVIERDEEFVPKYHIDVLIDEYIESFSEEEKQQVMTRGMVMSIAIENVVTMAKESFEYAPIWEARLEENFDLADKLMVDLQAHIRSRLKNADASRVDILDSEDPDGLLFDSFLNGMSDFDELDRGMYETQTTEQKQQASERSEEEIAGEAEAFSLYEQWLEEPARTESELRKFERENLLENGEPNEFLISLRKHYERFMMEHQIELSKAARIEEENKEPTEALNEGGAEVLQESIDAQRKQETKEEQAQRQSTIHRNVTEKKEEKNVSGTTSGYAKQTSGFSGGYRSQATTKDKKPEYTEGMFDYSSLPDGDQFEEPVVNALPEGVYQAMEFPEDEIKPKSRIERMKQVRKENPKLGKNAGESMQKGIALGRVYTLPDKEDVKRARTSFSKRPFHFLKTKAREFHRAHRKAVNVMLKMTAFVAVQLGVNVLSGRMEMKEDRHFVQMIALTMMSFYLTQSLNKDGMPVANGAFVM